MRSLKRTCLIRKVIGRPLEPGRYLRIELIFEPRDIWVGVFLDHWGKTYRSVYVGFLPCLILHVRTRL